MNLVEDQIRRVDDTSNRMVEKMTYRLEKTNQKLSHFGQLLESYSFKKVLKRGFAIAKNKDGVVSSAVKAKAQSPTSLIFHDGEVNL